MEAVFVLVPIVILLAIVLRLAAGGMDQERIRQYVESRGGRLLQTKWAPFGPGWFGEKSDRIYAVHYLDRDGNEHEAHCKTSLWTGVYFTRDEIVSYAQRTSPACANPGSLEAENRRLREEIERLKRHQRGP